MNDSVIRILKERCGSPCEPTEGRWVLDAEPTYHFEGDHVSIQALEVCLGTSLAKSIGGALRVTFGNSVGFYDLPHLGRIEVRSGKWGPKDFEWMLRDLMDVASALPFAAASSSALPYDRSITERDDVLYHAFVYLRHILSESAPKEDQLLPSLRAILRDPDRRFTRTTTQVPLELAREIQPRDLPGLFAPSAQLTSVGGSVPGRMALSRALNGFLPRYVPQTQTISTFDTPENRFVKAFLTFSDGIIQGVKRAAPSRSLPKVFRDRVLGDCEAMERLLRPIRQASLWSEVGPMVHLPVSSTVLQRRSGYQDILRHFVRLRQSARVPISPQTVRDLLETKNIAHLYELWTFFALVRELQSDKLLGVPTAAQGAQPGTFGVTVERDLRVEWSGRATLCYNPCFSRGRTGLRHSYSVALRPDIALRVQSGAAEGLHLFDAKFKLERPSELLPDEGEEPETIASDERRGSFTRGDLYKMHTYRDAIPATRSVWALYPGDDFAFFERNRPEHHLIPDNLQPEFADGVGAIPFIPGETTPLSIRSLLDRLLKG